MLLHVGFLVKSFAAVLARVRSRVRVDQQVSGQRGRALESLAALFALLNKKVLQRVNYRSMTKVKSRNTWNDRVLW